MYFIGLISPKLVISHKTYVFFCACIASQAFLCVALFMGAHPDDKLNTNDEGMGKVFLSCHFRSLGEIG